MAEVKVNEYYDGRVKSLEFENSEGKFTVGVMFPGDWEFEAPTREWMTLTRGSWDAKLPGSDEFVPFGEGESFQVEAGESFTLRVKEISSYLCPFT